MSKPQSYCTRTYWVEPSILSWFSLRKTTTTTTSLKGRHADQQKNFQTRLKWDDLPHSEKPQLKHPGPKTRWVRKRKQSYSGYRQTSLAHHCSSFETHSADITCLPQAGKRGEKVMTPYFHRFMVPTKDIIPEPPMACASMYTKKADAKNHNASSTGTAWKWAYLYDYTPKGQTAAQ